MSVLSEARNVANRIVNAAGIQARIVSVIRPNGLGFVRVNELRIGESYWPPKVNQRCERIKREKPAHSERKGQGSKGQATQERLEELSAFYAGCERYGIDCSPFDGDTGGMTFHDGPDGVYVKPI